jgi:hypothetical protein
MRIRDLAALVTAALATPVVPASAQRTGDQARLIFSVAGGYIDGRGLWRVSNQPLQTGAGPDDVIDVARATTGKFAAGMSGTYFKGEHLGLTADVFIFELGYADACRVVSSSPAPRTTQVCTSIDEEERSALAATLGVGVVYRLASRELISPFARVSAGLFISNQSSIEMIGEQADRSLVFVYDDPRRSRVAPTLSIGVGTTTPIGRGFQFRWEVRDNILGIERVDGPLSAAGGEPEHSVGYKHVFSVLLGVDLVLERQRGRRY